MSKAVKQARELFAQFGIKTKSIGGRLEYASETDQLRVCAARSSMISEVESLDYATARLRKKADILGDLAGKIERGEVDATGWDEQRLEEEVEKLMPKILNSPEPLIPQSADGRLSDDEWNADIASKMVKKATHNVDQQEELVNRVQDAKAALALAVETFRKDTIDFMDEMDGYLLRIRQTRMALDTESKHILTQLKDVRQFFLSEQHVEEVKRLQEFTAMVGKLHEFKASGLLDAITDTILKLEVE